MELYPRHEVTELIPDNRFNFINSDSSGRQKMLHLGASPETFHSCSYFTGLKTSGTITESAIIGSEAHSRITSKSEVTAFEPV